MTGSAHAGRKRVDPLPQKHPNSHQIERLAACLESAFRIPAGDHLVAVLGDGSETSNSEALRTWVSREVHRIQREAVNGCMPQLADQLHRRMCRWDGLA
ncbi:hypothetical protein SAMN05421693_11810 [Ectothiorhodospira magna]|uniref:Uncharacterized protein n=1 Tax=Ectothiorhodospira magna TaxID=867345 RepID=A0A1H9DJZ9_9GAMM|nr:hypothetical protein SAMN05421693_11810 [Ectothiorhodospira magna]